MHLLDDLRTSVQMELGTDLLLHILVIVRSPVLGTLPSECLVLVHDALCGTDPGCVQLGQQLTDVGEDVRLGMVLRSMQLRE